MNLVAFIQARSGSKRFPGKVHQMLGGKTVVGRVMWVAAGLVGWENVYVLWPEDWPGVAEDDVLGRFYAALSELPEYPDGIIRLTADCPLLDPQVCRLVMGLYANDPAEYVSNVYPRRTFPDGLDCEIFTPEALRLAHASAPGGPDREHVTTWMQKNLSTSSVELPIDWSHVRLTLDTPEDLVWLKQVLASPRSGTYEL